MLRLIMLAALMMPLFCQAQTGKVGLVDIDAIMEAMPETATAQNRLNELSQKYYEEYTKMNEEVKRIYDQIKDLPADEPTAIRERKTREFADLQQKIQRYEQDVMADMQAQGEELKAPIRARIMAAVEQVALEEDFSFVRKLDPEEVYFYKEPYENITQKVKDKLGL